MKIVVCYPPLNGKGSPMLGQNRQFQWYHAPSFIYPMVPAMAATVLKRDGFDVIWKDAIAERCSWEKFENFFKKEGPDLVVMETKTPVVKQHWDLINRLKDLHPCKFALMGDHVTALPAESMENCDGLDFALTGGDYDALTLGVARHLRDGSALPKGVWHRLDGTTKSTGEYELTQDLNALPFVDRDLTQYWRYREKWARRLPFMYTMAGRDCPWAKCTFCSWTTLFPRFRTRSPENLLDEIGELIEKYGVREIFDDTGTLPAGGWLERFCEGLLERGYSKRIQFSANMRFGTLKAPLVKLMKRAGFRKLKVGLESGNQATLDRLQKGVTVGNILEDCRMISREGIDLQLTVMVGYPWESAKDAEETIRLARTLMERGWAEMLQATVVVPYPGTPLYRQGVEDGVLTVEPGQWERFDMSAPVFKTPDMTPEEVMTMARRLYLSFFTPRFMIRRLTSIRSIDDVKYILGGVRAVQGHVRDFLRRPSEDGCSGKTSKANQHAEARQKP